MAIILFDDDARNTLLPLTYTRPVADLRIGILTIAEKWAKYLDSDFSFHTQPYLQAKFPLNIQNDNIFINGAVCPDEDIVAAIQNLGNGRALRYKDTLLAVRMSDNYASNFDPFGEYQFPMVYDKELVIIKHPEDIFKKNDNNDTLNFLFAFCLI